MKLLPIAEEARMRSTAQVVEQFKQDWTEEPNPLNVERACRDSGMNWIDSMLNPVVTIRLFFLQVLHVRTPGSGRDSQLDS